MGSRYESGRVLLVGAIHNADQLFTPEILALGDEVKKWMAAPRTTEAVHRRSAQPTTNPTARRCRVSQIDVILALEILESSRG
jgi:hypothetical protein